MAGFAVPVAGCAGETATSGVEPDDPDGATDARSGSSSPSTVRRSGDSAELPSALRAAVIAATQREADDSFGARAQPEGLLARAPTFDVRYDELGAHLEFGGADYGRLALAGAGCEGSRAVDVPSRPLPTAQRNRVAYGHTAAEVDIDAWYLTGPMGLEQGFTVREAPACVRAGGALELVVDTDGFSVEPSPDGAVLVAASGERFRYTDLFAKDANGRELPSRMRVDEDGRLALVVDVAGAAWPVEIDPLVSMQQVKLTIGNGSSGFGRAVAVSGDTAVVGAPFDNNGAIVGQGSAYVFVRGNGSWMLRQKLLAADGDTSDWFGSSVALHGDTAAIGAAGDTIGSNQYQGSAYLFVRVNGSWTQQAKLVAADGAPSDRLGSASALSGDTLVLGAYGDDIGANLDQGSAYVFVRTNGMWSQQAKLVANDGAADDAFAQSVSISGDTVVVGAPQDDTGMLSSHGSAYVFVRTNGTWSQQAKLVASDAATGDYAGRGVAVDADSVLVGADGDTIGANSSQGSVYAFVRSNGTWSQQAKLTAVDGLAGDRFGRAVALRGELAAIGAPRRTEGMLLATGVGYVFTRTNGSWAQELKLVASAGASDDLNGGAVATSGNTVALGVDAGIWGQSVAQAHLFTVTKTNGDTCATGSECSSGFCVDGVCCNALCGGGQSNDCQACSVAAGAAINGACSGTTGNACTDANACTMSDLCTSGVCTPGAPVDCDDGNACTTESCNAMVGCESVDVADGTACDDGNVCSDGDSCVAGACTAGGGLDCDDGNACTTDGCDEADPAGCVYAPRVGEACDDGDACTVEDACADDGSGSAVCASGTTIHCDDGNACTVDACDAATGCTHDAEPDGTPCPSGECQGGACGPSPSTSSSTAASSTTAGAGGAEVGTGGVGGESSGGGAGTGGSDVSDEAGCACRSAGTQSAGRGLGGALVGLGVALAARRRRRR